MTLQSETMYRSNLESVLDYVKNKYGDNRRVLGVSDISEYTGKCYRVVKRDFFNGKSTNITVETFARKLANL